MNNVETNKTDEVLAEILKKAMSAAEKTGEFVINQAPDLLREFYRWHIAECICGIILSFIIFIAAYRIPFRWLDKEEEYNDIKYFNRWGNEGAMMAWGFFIVGSIISLTIFVCNVFELVFIIAAPKLYLIEYFVK